MDTTSDSRKRKNEEIPQPSQKRQNTSNQIKIGGKNIDLNEQNINYFISKLKMWIENNIIKFENSIKGYSVFNFYKIFSLNFIIKLILYDDCLVEFCYIINDNIKTYTIKDMNDLNTFMNNEGFIITIPLKDKLIEYLKKTFNKHYYSFVNDIWLRNNSLFDDIDVPKDQILPNVVRNQDKIIKYDYNDQQYKYKTFIENIMFNYDENITIDNLSMKFNNYILIENIDKYIKIKYVPSKYQQSDHKYIYYYYLMIHNPVIKIQSLLYRDNLHLNSSNITISINQKLDDFFNVIIKKIDEEIDKIIIYTIDFYNKAISIYSSATSFRDLINTNVVSKYNDLKKMITEFNSQAHFDENCSYIYKPNIKYNHVIEKYKTEYNINDTSINLYQIFKYILLKFMNDIIIKNNLSRLTNITNITKMVNPALIPDLQPSLDYRFNDINIFNNDSSKDFIINYINGVKIKRMINIRTVGDTIYRTISSYCNIIMKYLNSQIIIKYEELNITKEEHNITHFNIKSKLTGFIIEFNNSSNQSLFHLTLHNDQDKTATNRFHFKSENYNPSPSDKKEYGLDPDILAPYLNIFLNIHMFDLNSNYGFCTYNKEKITNTSIIYDKLLNKNIENKTISFINNIDNFALFLTEFINYLIYNNLIVSENSSIYNDRYYYEKYMKYKQKYLELSKEMKKLNLI